MPSPVWIVALFAAPFGFCGCSESYVPGSLISARVYFEADGVRSATSVARRLGCLDVRVTAGQVRLVSASPLFEFAFGNRCDVPVPVDFTRVRATGRFAEGEGVAMRAFDPGSELRPATLGAHRAGREVIEFDPPDGAGTIVSVCVDITRLAVGGDGRQEICFRRAGALTIAESE
jgi:hypothetical protein